MLVEVVLFTLLRPQAVTVHPWPACLLEGKPVTASVRLETAAVLHGDCQVEAEGAPARRFRGEFRIRRGARELQVILKADVEELVAAIVSAESPPGASSAMLEAQAIVARSWLLGSKRRHQGYDFCDTTHCQHFKQATERGVDAARATRRLVLTWQGEIFAPAYSASCGGQTMTAREIGWSDRNQYPYFSVECPVCVREETPWTRPFSGEFAKLLVAAPNQERIRLAIGRKDGWAALPSNRYVIKLDGETVLVTGRGHGHGLGLCQRGAAQFSTSAAILAHFYPGAAVTAVK